MSKEEIYELVDKDSRGNYVRVGLSNYKGKEYTSIREMYTDNDGNIQFGSKGINFNSEITYDVVMALIKTMDLGEIQDVIDRSSEYIRTEIEG